MQEGIKGLFSSVGESFTFYKEQFSKIMFISITILVPLDILFMISKQLSMFLPGFEKLYYVLIPVIFALAQLPFIWISVMFIKDEIFDLRDIYSLFFKKLSVVYVSSLFFSVLMFFLLSVSKILGIVGFFLSFSLPYIVVLKEYKSFLSIGKSIQLGFEKWLQLLILISTSLIFYWLLTSGIVTGIDMLGKDLVPEFFYVLLKIVMDMLMVPFIVYIVTKCYWNWLVKE